MSITTQGRTLSDFRTIPTIVGDSAIMTTADRADLQYWKIEFSGDDRKTWTGISTGTTRQTTPMGPIWKSSNVPDGDYWIRSVMVNKAGNFGDPCEIKIIVKNGASASVAPSCKDASATIITPRMDGVVSQRVSVNGSAEQDNFSYYQIQYSSDRKTWIDTAIRSRTPLVNGTLGVWDATALPDGDYWLRVLVVDKSANYQNDPCQLHVILRNNAAARSTPLCGTSPSAYIAWLQVIPPAGNVVTIKSLQPPPTVSDMLGFFGSVNATDFARYAIQFSADQKTWTDAMSSNSPQLAETGIGGWQTRLVPNGDYWLHLRVVNKSGNYQDYCEMRVTVKN